MYSLTITSERRLLQLEPLLLQPLDVGLGGEPLLLQLLALLLDRRGGSCRVLLRLGRRRGLLLLQLLALLLEGLPLLLDLLLLVQLLALGRQRGLTLLQLEALALQGLRLQLRVGLGLGRRRGLLLLHLLALQLGNYPALFESVLSTDETY